VILQGGHNYIMNETGKTLYVTKIAYGNREQVTDIIPAIRNNEVGDIIDYESIRWFVNPMDKIRVAKGTESLTITYVDFQTY